MPYNDGLIFTILTGSKFREASVAVPSMIDADGDQAAKPEYN